MMPGAYPDQAASPAPKPVYQHAQAHEIDPQHQQPDDSYAQHTAVHSAPPNQPIEFTQHDPRFGGHTHEQSYYTQQQPDSASPHHDSGWQQLDSHNMYRQQPPSAQAQAMHDQAIQADPQGYHSIPAGHDLALPYHSIPSEHNPARCEQQWDAYQQAAPPGQPGAYDIVPSRQAARPPSHRPRRAAFPTNEEGHGYQYRQDDLDSGNGATARSGRRPKRHKRQVSDQQQIQVVLPDSRGKDDTARSLSEQMQMMMMNQMMSQQMTAQQMQFAQMNAMLQNTPGSVGGGKDEKRATKRKKKPSVNIKSKQMGRGVTRPLPIVAAAPPAPPVSEPTIESAAMENWQEATIILCIAIVGVIYLVVSRSNKEEEKEASAAAKHLVPKG